MTFEDKLDRILNEVDDPSSELDIRKAEERAEDYEDVYVDRNKLPADMPSKLKKTLQGLMAQKAASQQQKKAYEQATDAIDKIGQEGGASAVQKDQQKDTQDRLKDVEEQEDAIDKQIEANLIAYTAKKRADKETNKASGAGIGSSPGGAVTGTAIGGAVGPSVREEIIKKTVHKHFADLDKYRP